MSISRFGEKCGIFSNNSTSLLLSSLTIPSFSMSLSTKYAFTVIVTAPDGRSDSKRVVVSPAFNGSVLLSISTRFVKFNPGGKLIVTGNIRAQTAVTSFWSVRSALGVPISYKSLTPQTKEFPLASAVTFPLSVASGTFIGGNSYLFRLTAYPLGSPKFFTYSEILLTANTPPRGGYLYAKPTSGVALMTDFFISTPGWTTDVENLPLRYEFSFRVSASSEYLTLAAASQRDYTESSLPAGLPVIGYDVILKGKAIDMLNSSSSAITNVTVNPSQNMDTSRVLSTSLNRAFLTGDVNLAYQAINTAATTISTADCSASPNCFELNRNYCFLTIGTCGRCFDGFSGASFLISLATL
jgi:REJ domain